jgi:hypothetical protein
MTLSLLNCDYFNPVYPVTVLFPSILKQGEVKKMQKTCKDVLHNCVVTITFSIILKFFSVIMLID